MERKEAEKLWLTTYMTGRPCKNGHNSYRYTQSGTCSKCVNNTITKPEDKDFCILKVRVWKSDVDQINAAMYFAMTLRRPGIKMNEVTHRGKRTNQIGESAVLHYLVHKEDSDSLLKYATGIFNSSMTPVDMSIIKGRHKKVAINNPLPAWKA